MVRIAPDANDVLVYQLNDPLNAFGPTTFLNSGTQGASGNWTSFGTPIPGAQGLFGNALYVVGTPTTSNIDGAGGANDVLITPNISISGWVYIKRYSSSPLELFNKQYRLNAWSSPFLTFGFQMTNSNDGRCDLFITTGAQGAGSLNGVNTNNNGVFLVQARQWNHIGGTWDGSTLKFYLNGNFAASASFSNAIDYNTVGNRGEWYVGGPPGANSTNQNGSAIFQDIRIANIVRPQSYFANIYYNGLFVNG